MRKGNRLIKAKKWYIVTWVNEKVSKDYPVLHSVFGSDERIENKDNMIYQDGDFIEHYHVKKIITLKEYKRRFDLNDLLDKAVKDFHNG